MNKKNITTIMALAMCAVTSQAAKKVDEKVWGPMMERGVPQ